MHFEKVWLVLFLGLVGFTYNSAAQRYKENTPLHKFLQENFDSTIIYYSWSNWYSYPKYQIISKQGTSVYFFTYKSPYQMIGGMAPNVLAEKFVLEEMRFRQTPPDTNRYFLPKYVMAKDRDIHWKQVNDFDVWNVGKDKYEPGGCNVYDDGTDTFYLISKSGVKVLDYYAPDFFETCKPKNINRQNVIRTRDVMKKIFADCTTN